MLKKEIEECDQRLERLRNDLSEKEKALKDHSAEEYAEELMEKEAFFEKKKTACRHWKHILEVFQQIKEASAGNPMQDIEENFRRYLSVLSDGSIALKQLDDRLDTVMSSGSNQLTYEILSEGTKDTISLAFRLAVLEHLFPDGDGLAVFDDPFTDMDADRKEIACRLLKEFAEKNQVIFVTCDPGYADLLGGNVIPF